MGREAGREAGLLALDISPKSKTACSAVSASFSGGIFTHPLPKQGAHRQLPPKCRCGPAAAQCDQKSRQLLDWNGDLWGSCSTLSERPEKAGPLRPGIPIVEMTISLKTARITVMSALL